MNKTDADIEKALECCDKENGCYECPYEFACYDDKYKSILSKDALDYINRLKAEIERLQAVADAELDTIHDMGEDYERVLEEEPILIQKAKAEAIKEFAERLTDRICENVNRSLDNPNGNNYYPIDVYNDIDNLVKEMMENEGKE